MFSDATAANGIARRRGMGRIRHLDATDLWIQEKFTSKAATIDKVLGTKNPADILTKHVDGSALRVALQKMGMAILDGRSDVAPQAMGVQNQLLNKRQRRLAMRSLWGWALSLIRFFCYNLRLTSSFNTTHNTTYE